MEESLLEAMLSQRESVGCCLICDAHGVLTVLYVIGVLTFLYAIERNLGSTAVGNSGIL